ncbi:MAG: hypothetical protein U0791_01585 [Gemmataceae bacterium]
MFAGLLLVCLGAPPEEPQLPVANEQRKDSLARFGAGVWQARRERLLTAVKSLESAAKLDPDSTAALKELVSAYARLGREPDAIRAARTVMERDPTDADTAHKLARLLNGAPRRSGRAEFAHGSRPSIDAADRPEEGVGRVPRLGRAGRSHGGRVKEAAQAWKRVVDFLTTRRKPILAIGAFTRSNSMPRPRTRWNLSGPVARVKAGCRRGSGGRVRGRTQLRSEKLNDKPAAARSIGISPLRMHP